MASVRKPIVSPPDQRHFAQGATRGNAEPTEELLSLGSRAARPDWVIMMLITTMLILLKENQ